MIDIIKILSALQIFCFLPLISKISRSIFILDVVISRDHHDRNPGILHLLKLLCKKLMVDALPVQGNIPGQSQCRGVILDCCLHQRIQHFFAVLVNLSIVMLHHAPKRFSIIMGSGTHIMKVRSQHQGRRLVRFLLFRFRSLPRWFPAPAPLPPVFRQPLLAFFLQAGLTRFFGLLVILSGATL